MSINIRPSAFTVSSQEKLDKLRSLAMAHSNYCRVSLSRASVYNKACISYFRHLYNSISRIDNHKSKFIWSNRFAFEALTEPRSKKVWHIDSSGNRRRQQTYSKTKQKGEYNMITCFIAYFDHVFLSFALDKHGPNYGFDYLFDLVLRPSAMSSGFYFEFHNNVVTCFYCRSPDTRRSRHCNFLLQPKRINH